MQKELQNAAEEVYNELGSSWTESVYHSAMQRELSERGVAFHSEGTIPVMYKSSPVGRRRPDMFIITENGQIVVEMKAGSGSGEAQLNQYLDMATENTDLGTIVGGAVIRFNEELEFEYTELES